MDVDGTGQATEETKGTPVIPDPPTDHTETLEETLQRHGIPYGDAAPSAESDDSAADGESEEEQQESEEQVSQTDDSEESPDGEPATDWAAVLAQSPQRVNEVPARQRGETVKQAIERVHAEAQARMEREWRQYEQKLNQDFETRLQAWQKMSEFERKIDDLRESDPDTFQKWQTENPQNAAVYFQWKARGSGAQPPPPPRQQQQPAVSQAEQEYDEVLKPYIDRIQGRQDIIDELDRRDPNGTIFVRTPKGVEAFKKAVDELTDAEKPAARKAAAETRAKRPKADATPSGGPSKLTKAQIAEMSPDQVARLSVEQLEEAMASS